MQLKSYEGVSKSFRTEVDNEVYAYVYLRYKSHDSSVCLALGYGLDGRGSTLRFPTGAGNFSVHHRV
jgi:hypothetical protein